MHSCTSLHRLHLRRAAVAPLTALCLGLLVGVAALVIDGGTLMEARRHVQAAADAAALAGADDLYTNYPTNQGIDYGTAQVSATDTAAANGFTNDNSTVTVRTSGQTYLGGPNAGQTVPPGYIEVSIQYNAPHLFSGVFGSGATPVRARAVARGRCTPLNYYNGLFALNLNLSAALKVFSTGGLTVNGGIQVSSGNASAIDIGLTATVTATQFTFNPATGGLLGSILHLLFGSGGSSPTVVNSLPVPDPLRFLSPPDPIQLNLTTQGTNLSINSGTWDLYPGVYDGGIRIGGFGTHVILHANSDGTPGIYYLNGPNGFQVSSWATVESAAGETAGVMIYNNWSAATDSVNLNTYGAVTLVPPASGPYRGLCIFQKRGTPSTPGPQVILNANGSANVTGTIYAAHASVSLTTNSSTNVMGGQIIADTISISGLASVNIGPNGQPIANQRFLGLLE